MQQKNTCACIWGCAHTHNLKRILCLIWSIAKLFWVTHTTLSKATTLLSGPRQWPAVANQLVNAGNSSSGQSLIFLSWPGVNAKNKKRQKTANMGLGLIMWAQTSLQMNYYVLLNLFANKCRIVQLVVTQVREFERNSSLCWWQRLDMLLCRVSHLSVFFCLTHVAKVSLFNTNSRASGG